MRDTLTDRIKAAARQLGFAQVGIAAPEVLTEVQPRLKAWLAKGWHGQMRYMEAFSERHARFLQQLPEIRSLIVVAAHYHHGAPMPGTAAMGRVARYAVGRDYHRVLGKRLKRLVQDIRTMAGEHVAARWCVDTAPIHERSVAASAGLGFIGKNTCLIVPRGGSWLVLGVVATALDLTPDAPITQTCGNCTRCLEACPTEALVAPYALDARRCIAYLTLEHRGPIPEPLRPAIGQWVAGCDICQEVCPYNQRPAPATWPELTPAANSPGGGEGVPLREVLSIRDARTFESHFAGTALMRPTYQGLVRNAAIAAANSGDSSLQPLVRLRTTDPDPVIREAAQWACGRMP